MPAAGLWGLHPGVQKALPHLGTWNQAARPGPGQTVPVPGDQVVPGVAQGPRQGEKDQGQSPPAAQVTGHPERRVRPNEHPGPVDWGIDPDDGVHPVELRMLLPDVLSELALQGREPERAAPVVSQDELHALRAEAAGAVINEDRTLRRHRARHPWKVSQSSGRPDWNPLRNQLARCSDEP